MPNNKHAVTTLALAAHIGCSPPSSSDPELHDRRSAAGCTLCTSGGDELNDSGRPVTAVLRRMEQDALRDDGRIDEGEARDLAAFVRRYRSVSTTGVDFIEAMLDHQEALTESAIEELEIALDVTRPHDVPLSNAVYTIEPRGQDFLFDDMLTLHGEGQVSGHTGLKSHSRGYAAKRDGILFTRHGSLAPHHPMTTSVQAVEALRRQGPDEALDMAAAIFGVPLDAYTSFVATARDSNYYDPSPTTPYWAGICQGWTHNALDNRLSIMVDVEGGEGRRGLWIFGQWVSRADLGNALMGASYSLGIADSTTIDSFVTPTTLLLGLGQFVLQSGVGLRVDIWNDEHNPSGTYNPQVWNQPVLGASIAVSSLSPEIEAAILTFKSTIDGAHLPDGAQVRLVQATAEWGAEANDAWEGAPLVRDSAWTMYMVTDADGLVLDGFMANELAEGGVPDLPIDTSDGLPDYMAVPRHQITDAALEGRPSPLLDSGHGDGLRFRFLVGTVLARGIPDPTRRAFERDALVRGIGHDRLLEQYPGIANAYSPEQWSTLFEGTLGDGRSFGAAWGEWRSY